MPKIVDLGHQSEHCSCDIFRNFMRLKPYTSVAYLLNLIVTFKLFL
mgnify:CR=1 FL=1